LAPVQLDLRFKPGETRKTVRVRIRRDKLKEGQETFNVSLTQPMGVVIDDGGAVGAILP
jgi:hypothetical protein